MELSPKEKEVYQLIQEEDLYLRDICFKADLEQEEALQIVNKLKRESLIQSFNEPPHIYFRYATKHQYKVEAKPSLLQKLKSKVL